MSLTKKLIIVFVITAFAAIIMCVTTNINNSVSTKNEMISYSLGNAIHGGRVGVQLKYNVSPPDLVLQSPKGTMYNKTSAESYEIDTENKTITIFAISDETGIWSISFNKKDNTEISYEMLLSSIAGLTLTETDIIRLEDTYYLGFKYKADSTVNYHPSMTLKIDDDTKYDLIIADDLKNLTTNVNDDMIYLPIVLPKETYENEKKTAEIILTLTTDEGLTTSAVTKIQLTENAVSMSDIIKNQ